MDNENIFYDGKFISIIEFLEVVDDWIINKISEVYGDESKKNTCYVVSTFLKHALEECCTEYDFILEFGEYNGNGHYWLSTYIDNQDYIIDLTASQFGGIDGIFIPNESYEQGCDGSMINNDFAIEWKYEFFKGRNLQLN